MKTVRKVGRFFKRMVKAYFELNAVNYSRVTGDVWIRPEY